MTTTHTGRPAETHGYAQVNGLAMYYERQGAGAPLVYIPPAFGFAGFRSFPALVRSHSLISIDLQGHGRTPDIPERPLSIGQYAEDVVALLKYLGIGKADFFGQSYGGATAIWIAIHHPELVGRVATWGATFGPPQDAHNRDMLRFDHPPTADSSAFAFTRESYRSVAPDPEYWPKIWEKVANLRWDGFSKEELASVRAPVLIALGDRDFVRLEHAVEASKLMPNAELAVVPDAGHFAPWSEQERVMPIVRHFLEKPETRIPVASAGMGYHPGQTR